MIVFLKTISKAMKILKEIGLYKKELIPVKGKLVEQYNKCLLKLGFKVTALDSFFIDGIGWSPEIAEEKKDAYYLNHGDANSHAIIITPLQKGLPIYSPFHSYDKELMTLIFNKYQEKIENITRDSAICIDFDQDIDVFYEPLEVLKYQCIKIKFTLADDLDKAKKKQLELINLFKKENNFISEEIHTQLLNSANQYGDLRERELDLSDIIYNTTSFYTKAFGGIYVLKNFLSPIIVFEKKAIYEEAIQNTKEKILMFHISDKQLIEKLTSYLMIECDVRSEFTMQRYDRIKKYVLAPYLSQKSHNTKAILNDKTLFKGYLNKIDFAARKRVMGLERYLDKKTMDPSVIITDFVDDDIYLALHSPHSSLGLQDQELIWRLLLSISPKDMLFLYWYNKEIFYDIFNNMESSLRNWVIDMLSKTHNHDT